MRNKEQADILHKIGARHVVDSSAPDFMDKLTGALVETGATIAFDAIGGGKLAGQILVAMETAMKISDELVRDSAVREIVGLCMKANNIKTGRALFRAIHAGSIKAELLKEHPTLQSEQA